MLQTYRVFTENKCLTFSSYQQQSNESIDVTGNSGQALWQFIQNQIDTEIHLPMPFDDFVRLFPFVNAAGGLVVLDRSLLFIYRNGKWDLPKGWMDSGEFPMQTAMREVREECGPLDLTVTADLPIHTYHLYLLKGLPVIKKTQWFKMKATNDDQLFPLREEGISHVRFIPFDEVRFCMANSYPMLTWLWKEFTSHQGIIG
jgi:8-oxo-dGTP pyrophosphatase MutT (NUDIX family)